MIRARGDYQVDAMTQAILRWHMPLQDLRRAAECLQTAIRGIQVQAYFVDFEGMWAVELTPQFVANTASK